MKSKEAQAAHITITNTRVNWCAACSVADKGGASCQECNTQKHINYLQTIVEGE